MLCSYCEDTVKVLWRCWLSTRPIESQPRMCQSSKWHTQTSKILRIPL